MGGNGSLRYGRALAVVSVVVVIAIGFAISAARSSAQTGPRVILFVVDTSTSMAGKPLTDAKGALNGASAVLPEPTWACVPSAGRARAPASSGLRSAPSTSPASTLRWTLWRSGIRARRLRQRWGQQGDPAARGRPHHRTDLRWPVDLRRPVPGCAGAQAPARGGLPHRHRGLPHAGPGRVRASGSGAAGAGRRCGRAATS